MKEGPDIAETAALIGDPARANMLTALMGGKALTATELAQEAGVLRSTASAHLTKLVAGGLLRPRKVGRHKYFEIAGEEAAHALEALMTLASRSGRPRTRTGPRDPELRKARVCYNHLAGEMGVRLYETLIARGLLLVAEAQEDATAAVALTPEGARFFEAFGLDIAALRRARSPLCRQCLDWSERRTHLAGGLGRAVLARIEALGWATRAPDTRLVRFAPSGERAFSAWLDAGASEIHAGALLPLG